MPALIRRRDPDRADCWRIRPLWVIRDGSGRAEIPVMSAVLSKRK